MKRTTVRVATALSAFILGTTISTLWQPYRILQSPPPITTYLELISEYCIEQLARGADGEHIWKEELGPIAKTFESWNMTKTGIRFNFDACKIFGCAAGAQKVEIPFTALLHTRRRYGE